MGNLASRPGVGDTGSSTISLLKTSLLPIGTTDWAGSDLNWPAESDRAFFMKHPHRKFRIRRLYRSEAREVSGSCSCGLFYHTCVYNIARGVRVRIFFATRKHHPVDHFSEKVCEAIHKRLLKIYRQAGLIEQVMERSAFQHMGGCIATN